MRRKGMGKGMGKGYLNLAPLDSHIHSLSAKGMKTQSLYMLGAQDIRRANERASSKARSKMQLPYVVDTSAELNDFPPFPFPYFGDYVPEGWERVNEYFVDSSGFGAPDEPALTVGQFIKKIKVGRGYAITSAGQFQVYVGEYVQKRSKLNAKGEHYTIADVKRKNKEAGRYFFSKDTMNFFNSRVETTGNLINNKYFITSEKAPFEGSSRKYTVREFNPKTGKIDTVGKFQQYFTKQEAKLNAELLND